MTLAGNSSVKEVVKLNITPFHNYNKKTNCFQL